ncbi:MAG: hypothetical protein ACYTAN_13150 [Planctomycetota bacterium]|jgi:hypothetical protein
MGIICVTPFIFLIVVAALVIWIRMIVKLRRDTDAVVKFGFPSLVAIAGLAATAAAILTMFVYRPPLKTYLMTLYPVVINTAFVAVLASFPCFIVMESLSDFVPSRKRLLALLAAGLAAAALAGGFLLWLTSTTRETATVLKKGRLAALPESATDVRTFASYWGIYLAFHADADDIDAFLSDSPSASDPEPTVFNADHMYLPRGPGMYLDDYGNEYFRTHYYPDWFDPTITEKGRKYDIPYGSLVVNDATNTIYVEVIWR